MPPEASPQGVPLRPPSRRVTRQLPEEFGIVPTGDKPRLPISDRRFVQEGVGGLALSGANDELADRLPLEPLDPRTEEQHGYL